MAIPDLENVLNVSHNLHEHIKGLKGSCQSVADNANVAHIVRLYKQARRTQAAINKFKAKGITWDTFGSAMILTHLAPAWGTYSANYTNVVDVALPALLTGLDNNKNSLNREAFDNDGNDVYGDLTGPARLAVLALVNAILIEFD